MHVSHKRSRSSRSTRRPKSRFHKKVSRVLSSKIPIRKTGYALSSTVGIAQNELTSVGPILLQRISPLNPGSVGSLAFNAGSEFNCIPGTLVGDGFGGSTMYPKSLVLRGVLRNFVYSPATTVRMYLIRSRIGDVPTLSSAFLGLTSCKLIDKFNWTQYTLIAQKDFNLRVAQHTGNHYLPQSKPGGTSTNNCTGTYWDTPGVSVIGNTDTTYVTENVVYFNANTMSGSYAEHTMPFTWTIPLSKKVRKVSYQETNPSTGNCAVGDACGVPTTNTKDFQYQLFAYAYCNALAGSAPVLNSCILDEMTIMTYFKAPL